MVRIHSPNDLSNSFLTDVVVGILKKTDGELFIHSEIEWNSDKKYAFLLNFRYFRDPVVTHKVVKAREEYIKKVKEKANKEWNQT